MVSDSMFLLFSFSGWPAQGVSVRCVRVLIAESPLGFEHPECNLGNRERGKISRGNKREERRRKLWLVSGASRPDCAEDPPSDDGDQNDKQ
jgi:hypothetical protein